MAQNFFGIPEYIPRYPQFNENLDLTGFPVVPGADNKFWTPGATKASILLGVKVELEDMVNPDTTISQFWDEIAISEGAVPKIVDMILKDKGIVMGNIGKYWSKFSAEFGNKGILMIAISRIAYPNPKAWADENGEIGYFGISKKNENSVVGMTYDMEIFKYRLERFMRDLSIVQKFSPITLDEFLVYKSKFGNMILSTMFYEDELRVDSIETVGCKCCPHGVYVEVCKGLF
jgi:hypothetical protein